MPDKIHLRQMQALPLIAKVHLSQARIREWYYHFNGNVFISFSGGKDSTVLTHVVHEYFPDVPLVFVNTGLEYPEIQAFAKKMGAEFIRPKMQFSEVISTYGYPIISKENAEAIHYARKIRNSEGGVLQPSTTEGKSTARDSATAGIPVRTTGICMGGGTRTPGNETYRRRADITARRNEWDEYVPGKNRMETRDAYRQTSLQNRGGVQHTSADTQENAAEQPLRRNHSGGGIRQTGQTGDEEPSPG